MNQGGYLLLSIVAFFLTGVGLYAADRKLTIALRRFIHGWTSPESEPFPESKEKGLVYRQGARQRFAVAGTISLVQTLVSVYRLEFNPLLELATLVIESPVMVLGTYLGDRMGRLFDRAQPVFDAIDRIEEGKSTVGGEVREIVDDVTEKVRDARGKSEADPPAELPASSPPAETASPPEPEEDPRALMKKYTGE